MLQSFMNRYANSMESGVPDDEFLRRELVTIRSIYRNDYEQGLELLKKWSDAYIAMLFSGALIGIIIMVSVALFTPGDVQGTLRMSYLIILTISIGGIVAMYRAVPGDMKTHNLSMGGSVEQDMIGRMEIRIVPVTVIITIILFVLQGNFGLILLFIGLMFFPLGVIGYKDDSNIIARDTDFSTFIRGLGSVMGGKGITIGNALIELDKKSLIALQPLIDGVYSKLNLGLSEDKTWERFVRESGSNLIYKYLNIFRDSCELGGAPDIVGDIVSTSMLDQVLLREKRATLSAGFLVLLVPMHAMMVGIFLALYHILLNMSAAVSGVYASLGSNSAGLSDTGSVGGVLGGSMQMFAHFPEADVSLYVTIIISIITISNSISGKIVMGGNRYMIYFFGSLLCIVSGINYILAPYIIGLMFIIPKFVGI